MKRNNHLHRSTETVAIQFQRHRCPGPWQKLSTGRCRCSACGLIAMSLRDVILIDPKGAESLIDPTGLQRQFIAATGLD